MEKLKNFYSSSYAPTFMTLWRHFAIFFRLKTFERTKERSGEKTILRRKEVCRKNFFALYSLGHAPEFETYAGCWQDWRGRFVEFSVFGWPESRFGSRQFSKMTFHESNFSNTWSQMCSEPSFLEVNWIKKCCEKPLCISSCQSYLHFWRKTLTHSLIQTLQFSYGIWIETWQTR